MYDNSTSGDPVLGYNDVWNNTTNYYNVTASSTEISQDPMYVDRTTANYTLQSDSPALTAGSGNTQIGAYGDGGTPPTPPAGSYKPISNVPTQSVGTSMQISSQGRVKQNPTVTYIWPEATINENGEKVEPIDVSINTVIAVTFNHELSAMSDEQRAKNFLVWNIEGAVQGKFYQYGKTIVFIPDEALKENTSYIVTISGSITDRDGYPLDGNSDGVGGDNYTYGFTTGESGHISAVAPVIVALYPEDGLTDVTVDTSIILVLSEKRGTLLKGSEASFTFYRK